MLQFMGLQRVKENRVSLALAGVGGSETGRGHRPADAEGSGGSRGCQSLMRRYQAWKPGSQHGGEKRGVAGLLLGRTAFLR